MDFLLQLLRGFFRRPPTEWDTAGPHPPEDPIVKSTPPIPPPTLAPIAPSPAIGADGWGLIPGLRHSPIHVGRLGVAIKPQFIVDHTTDMLPEDFDGLLKQWRESKGGGNGAHFLIGRDEKQGCHQLASIYRNANHVGGMEDVDGSWVERHGWFKLAGSSQLSHPNLLCVGIEVHCAGELRHVNGQWRYGEGSPWKPTGKPIPDSDVEPDRRVGLGWHKPTQYQLDRLREIHRALQAVLVEAKPGWKLVPNGVQQFPWGLAPAGSRIVGHVSLDPNRKTDPGPTIMNALAAGDLY